jgi:hypothetical protein
VLLLLRWCQTIRSRGCSSGTSSRNGRPEKWHPELGISDDYFLEVRAWFPPQFCIISFWAALAFRFRELPVNSSRIWQNGRSWNKIENN